MAVVSTLAGVVPMAVHREPAHEPLNSDCVREESRNGTNLAIKINFEWQLYYLNSYIITACTFQMTRSYRVFTLDILRILDVLLRPRDRSMEMVDSGE